MKFILVVYTSNFLLTKRIKPQVTLNNRSISDQNFTKLKGKVYISWDLTLATSQVEQ